MAEMRGYRRTLLGLWLAGAVAAVVYASGQQIPWPVAAAVAPAFLLELSFYLIPGFEDVRRRFTHPAALVASAVAPYAVYSLGTGVFRWSSMALVALLAAAVVFWFRALPRGPFADLGFLALMSGVYLAKAFHPLYPSPTPDLDLHVLGQLMWIRLGLSTVMAFRPMEGVGFGFMPQRRDWLIGLRHFLYFLPVGLALIMVFGTMRFQPAPGLWWKIPATFVGILWVVALGEEFFFRGLLQQWLSSWLGSWAGLALASLLFGAVHLPFRFFPNWKFAAVAAVAGWFYGRAFLAGGGIRASMVTHALVVTTWRTLLG